MNINISRKKISDSFIYIVRICIGCMFIYSSLPKIRQPYDFLSNIYSYELIGPRLGMFVAMTLPWLELFVGICLIAGVFIGGALLVSIALASLFTFALGSALYQGLNISCGCFGSAQNEIISAGTLFRSVLILILSISAAVLYHTSILSDR
jgi:putative oxidoreductase